MNKPLYINDFSFRCILGSDKALVFEKLVKGIRGEFSMYDVAGVMRPAATISKESLDAVPEKKYDNRVNRLMKVSLDLLEPTILKTIKKFGANRVGLFIGSCDNGSEASIEALRCLKETGKFPEGYNIGYQSADLPARYIADRFHISGIASVHSTACASSASAFVSARNNIYAGNCDAAIVGGVDIASLQALLGFSSLEAMSDQPTNPFSANRSGLSIGDASAFFVVTREPCAELCTSECTGLKIVGFGESADADHITAPRADGEGAYQAMKAAVADAEISAAEIGYVNLHGTGTHLNDAMESRAINRFFGEYGNVDVPVSSTKALTGHTLGAAGALETAFCCLALKSGGRLPAHLYDGVKDAALPPVHLVSAEETGSGLKYCMSNSFAFGGCNVSLIIGADV